MILFAQAKKIVSPKESLGFKNLFPKRKMISPQILEIPANSTLNV